MHVCAMSTSSGEVTWYVAKEKSFFSVMGNNKISNVTRTEQFHDHDLILEILFT